jgi:Xaa-Pro dipeptidase
MTPPLEPDSQFKAHLDRILEAMGAAIHAAGADWLVVHSGLERMAFLDDQPYPYRPNPWFAWLAPVLHAPGSLILWRNNSKPILYFVSPMDYWHAPPAIPNEPWTREFELVSVPDAQSALAALPGSGERVCWLGEPAPPHLAWSHNPAQVLLELEQLRCRKSPYEVGCLREATRLGVAGHLAAEKAFRAGGSELAIHLAFLQASRQSETALPYGNIVALNENAATLHYQLQLPNAPAQRHSLLIDAGATCRGYASDITRTYATGPLDAELSETYEQVRTAQAAALAAAKSGVPGKELDRVARDHLAKAGTADFFVHSLGHGVGLEIHEGPGVGPRSTDVLREGMVITIEPGVYLPGRGGVRIEDSVVVTASGAEILTEYPRELRVLV